MSNDEFEKIPTEEKIIDNLNNQITGGKNIDYLNLKNNEVAPRPEKKKEELGIQTEMKFPLK